MQRPLEAKQEERRLHLPNHPHAEHRADVHFARALAVRMAMGDGGDDDGDDRQPSKGSCKPRAPIPYRTVPD